ncbi:MAG TPA: hypothetical protein VJT49_34075 [Amycolatopsis sp.]|uniref:hypothetical protein n=1 Tax=Amycolatopsis sp. TaxID=37632 RepID=UPI002B4974B7|nr:hypothetical protein [Amycolatopsis sp.]HKS50051.1 hypothetical protein [Amycolatopsis sp.]
MKRLARAGITTATGPAVGGATVEPGDPGERQGCRMPATGYSVGAPDGDGN